MTASCCEWKLRFSYFFSIKSNNSSIFLVIAVVVVGGAVVGVVKLPKVLSGSFALFKILLRSFCGLSANKTVGWDCGINWVCGI